ncbi:MetQ/NlpA family ABC transporter substrate-binding protein [Pseudoroseomonas wenyumeiae]|uniref:Lipoprotein n=1 Tax=Teichococcus wenyumeiae TaxID=2478470 RepID=A0A3A9JNI3_9PROT|nr:MetQ/NlpA family ABC transporter substrate-binding protein [Pseudoroseomonas wenyumeiae]RKK05354.1 MetQ/NlpA family ABC transporter substrate-binding protein [Pseudoroseomonas wenyumeiae]RMI25557.1 MetQ/NlpA family ABC transporter substrate-binding protein [Pseudoroseomonas wenyumeiae]
MQRRPFLLAVAGGLFLPAALRAQGAAEIGTAARPLRVGVTSGVHAQVLEQVRDVLARENFVVKITEFADFIQPNVALAGGEIDINTYQHQPFLDAQKAQRGYDFVPVGKTVLTVMGVFSRKVKNLADLPNGARVAIPNDPTNGGRALLLLAKAGVFKLRDGADFKATVADIAENPKRIRIVELEAASIARSLDDVDAAAITGNYAVPAGLNPLKDGLAVEGADSAYTVLVVTRRGDENKPWAQKLARAYADPAVKAFVEKTFGGSVIVGA